MSIVIKQLDKKRQLGKFVKFGIDLYKGNPYFCPPLIFDEKNTFKPIKNPALEVCDYVLYMAYKDGRPAGRIAGIVNRRANEKWNVKKCRFGWFDFIEDYEVFKALLDKVSEWGRQQGMDQLNGPVGFTDFDHEGLLLEGYDYNAPMASLYNYPYYVDFFERYGLEKEADWIEYQIQHPTDAPERMKRVAKIVEERSHVHAVKVRNAKELVKRYGYTFFDVFDIAYQKLYNYQPMTERQKQYYCQMYFPLVNYDFVTLVVNDDDKVVAVGVGMPSLSDALRKCRGRIFPLGWYYCIKALKAKKIDDFDLLLIAVLPEYQDKGINSLLFADMGPYFGKYQVQRVETTSILETNLKNQANFADLEKIQHKRRRAYQKSL